MDLLQTQASNPNNSVWVSASAGTGKTKILVDRILRLLLKKINFNKILALTFTNAAATEMQVRLEQALLQWANYNNDSIIKAFKNNFNYSPTRNEIKAAQNLYPLYLKNEEKIGIYTIHSFCQKLLKQFSIEANISPEFEVIDEVKTFEIILEVKHSLNKLKELEPINQFFAQNFHEITIEDVINEIIKNKTKFIQYNNFSFDKNNSYKNQLLLINKINNYSYEKYQNILTNSTVKRVFSINASINDIKSTFLTKTGEKKKRIMFNKVKSNDNSDLEKELKYIQNIIYSLDQEEKKTHLECYSQLFDIFAKHIILEYEKHKSLKGYLDYNDLIQKTKTLLQNSESKEWVLYKIDGGIDHLLIDEAQDTNKSQWQIIQALTEEFYSGDNHYNIRKTLFVVGDEKQSIFSFQGVDSKLFKEMHNFFLMKFSQANYYLLNIDLNISYRSSKAITYCVDKIFNEIKNDYPKHFTAKLVEINPFRKNSKSSVEVWDISKGEKTTQTKLYNTDNYIENNSKILLAQKIANYIAKTIESKIILKSTQNYVSAADFMILFRKRDNFTIEVINAIKAKGLPIGSIDRFILEENLAVKDLISLAKFVINNDDNLNLSSLLKSPIIGISDQFLYNLIKKKTNQSLWSYIKQSNNHNLYDRLNIYNKIYKNYPSRNFLHYSCEIMSLRTKLGEDYTYDSNDAINELIYLNYNYFKNHSESLQNFIFWLESYPSIISKDTKKIDKIKIMTVHGAKGLQSPYVIICDTTNIPSSSGYFLWDKTGKSFFAKDTNLTPQWYKSLKLTEKEQNFSEYLRLLYVAMTRAEDHLIICGYLGNKPLPENCWYNLILKTIKKITKENSKGHYIYTTGTNNINHSLKESNNNKLLPDANYITNNNQNNQVLEQTNKTLPADIIKDKKNNSSIIKNNITTLLKQKKSLEYGIAFHKILEDSISINNLSIIISHPIINRLSEPLQIKIKNSIKAIYSNQILQELLKNPLKTEIYFGKHEPNIIGRIDLLIFCPNKLVIIDYKTDKFPPLTKDKINQKYKNQLHCYCSIIKKIYTVKVIEAWILWLENGSLIQVF